MTYSINSSRRDQRVIERGKSKLRQLHRRGNNPLTLRVPFGGDGVGELRRGYDEELAARRAQVARVEVLAWPPSTDTADADL